MKRINWRASPLHTAIAGVINSGMQLISAFGVHMTSGQNVAVTGEVNSLLLAASLAIVQSTNGRNGQS